MPPDPSSLSSSTNIASVQPSGNSQIQTPRNDLLTPTPIVHATSTPPSGPSDDLPLSDLFWDEFVAHVNPVLLDYEYASLKDATDQAHLVLVGRVVEVYVGEDWRLDRDEPSVPFAYARIAVDEALKGQPVSRDEGFVELQLAFVDSAWEPEQVDPLPTHSSLFFVMHEATDRRLRGLRPRESEIAPFAYFIPTPQAILRDIGGRIAVLGRPMLEVHYGPDGFPLPLQGASFVDVVEAVRQLRT